MNDPGAGNSVSDFFIVKYDANGNVLWAKSAGGNKDDAGHGVSVDASGNVFVTGIFYSSSISFGSTTLTGNGSADLFVVKYDANGNVLWAKSAGGSAADFGKSISVESNGNIFVTGYFQSPSISFGSTTLTNNGSGDLFIVKYDPDGNALWAKSAGGSNFDAGNGASADASGNVCVTGAFSSPSITFGSTTLTNAATVSYPDMFIVKYDSIGNVLWAKSAGGSKSDEGYGIGTGADGNMFVTGDFSSSSVSFGSTTLTNSGSFANDLFIVKYDANGNVSWAKSAGGLGSGDDQGRSVSADTSGNVFVAGHFGSLSITFGSTTLINSGSYDMFIAKLNGITGIENLQSDNSIAVYPNPSRGKFTIERREGQWANGELEIYNVLGEKVYGSTILKGANNNTLHGGGQIIDISSRPGGVYFLQVKSDLEKSSGETTAKKLVIQK